MRSALRTTVVGSYPQPGWLIDRERLGDRLPSRGYASEAIDRALDGIEGETVLDTGFGYANIAHDRPSVAQRIRRAPTVLPPERLVVAPDCGMKYPPPQLAFRKLEAMVTGARLLREELGL